MWKIPIDLHMENDGVLLKERELPRRNKFYVYLYEKEYILFTPTIRMSYGSRDLKNVDRSLGST
jgi:hypothetical protein